MSKRNHFSVAVLAAFMASGLPLKAASYAPVKGTYNGLFFQTNGAWEQSAGLIAITTTSRGAYSAKVQVGANHYSHSGALSADGEAAFQVAQRYGDWLHVAFQVDLADTDVIVGTVSNSTWVAAFYADRAVFDGRVNVCTNAGRYTLILPGDPSSTNSPGGDSYGTVNLSTSGRLTFSGFLADGHRVSQSATVSKDGRWPLFIPLYSGYGALYSWLLFNDSTNGAISGTVAWEKPALSWNGSILPGSRSRRRFWGRITRTRRMRPRCWTSRRPGWPSTAANLTTRSPTTSS